jgi:hypothetical protein
VEVAQSKREELQYPLNEVKFFLNVVGEKKVKLKIKLKNHLLMVVFNSLQLFEELKGSTY